MAPRPIIVWYRNDLRVDDHEPLRAALSQGTAVPVYCFDPRQFAETPEGFAKTGPFRTRFLRESVADLRESLRALGGDLVIRHGRPEDVLPALAAELDAAAVHLHAEVTSEETDVERAVTDALTPLGVTVRAFWGATLHHPDDLPFAIADLPEVFTRFRGKVEKRSSVRPPLDAPATLPSLPQIDMGSLPSPAELGAEEREPDPRGVLPFRGGESEARARLEAYLWQDDLLRVYKETRNGMLGADYSSKLSPWLALGCVSPRRVHDEVSRYERERVRNDSTYWLIFELRWRDYFRFICAKHGTRVFQRGGLRRLDLPWRDDPELFERWRMGTTGYPLVDANMRELAATGFMSNRGRQNVASFLTKNLGLDWRLGASWFESKLVDYDVCSNWGNWNYVAGVGNDARGFRWFHILKQAERYDPDGSYVRHWLPELAGLRGASVHAPWELPRDDLERAGVRLGEDYPRPVVDFHASIRANERVYEEAAP
ncbi:MAG: DASH family cryptochrome [Planctomycetota bacterium]|nr:DASH family cryptochrome [Planctomycetota bacterium]